MKNDKNHSVLFYERNRFLKTTLYKAAIKNQRSVHCDWVEFKNFKQQLWDQIKQLHLFCKTVLKIKYFREKEKKNL